MWPSKRKKKSARNDLKQVYYYKDDYTTLKILSREKKKSMTQMARDMIMVYIGYEQGIKQSQIDKLQLERDALIYELKIRMKELGLYRKQFGKITDPDSKQTSTDTLNG